MVAVLPGGARFVSGSYDCTAKLWTLDGALERTFEVGSWVRCVAALPDGVHFVVGLENKEVRLYHVDGTLVHAFKGHTLNARAVAVTPDGQHIVSGSINKLVKVWRGPWPVTHLVRTIEAHTNTVRALAVLPSGRRFISGSLDGTAKLWTFGGELERTFEVGSPVRCVAALPDGVHFVVCLLYTSPSPRDATLSRMPSSA